MNEIKNKVALVTGGTKGIGRAIAEALLNEQVNVVICSRHEEEVKKAVQQIKESNKGKAAGTVCDVRDYKQVKALIDYAVQAL